MTAIRGAPHGARLATSPSNAAFWHEKADELREVAAKAAEPKLRRRLSDLADEWDALANESMSRGC